MDLISTSIARDDARKRRERWTEMLRFEDLKTALRMGIEISEIEPVSDDAVTGNAAPRINDHESTMPVVFIAHSHRDAKAALAFVTMVEYAFDRKVNTFCTSKEEDKIRDVTSLPLSTPQYRAEVPISFGLEELMSTANYVVVLHTPNSLDSDFVNLETDAALFYGYQTAICLAGDVSLDHILYETYDLLFDLSSCSSALLLLKDIAKSVRVPLVHSDIDPYLSVFAY